MSRSQLKRRRPAAELGNELPVQWREKYHDAHMPMAWLGFSFIRRLCLSFNRPCACEIARRRSLARFIGDLDAVNRSTQVPLIDNEVFIVACIITDRLMKRCPDVVNTCGHCIVSVCLLLALKYLSDRQYGNIYWSAFVGLTVKDFNRMEGFILSLLSYNLFVSEDEFSRWADMSQREALACMTMPLFAPISVTPTAAGSAYNALPYTTFPAATPLMHCSRSMHPSMAPFVNTTPGPIVRRAPSTSSTYSSSTSTPYAIDEPSYHQWVPGYNSRKRRSAASVTPSPNSSTDGDNTPPRRVMFTSRNEVTAILMSKLNHKYSSDDVEEDQQPRRKRFRGLTAY
eukprot:Clim_evm60s25 gene=Clim_evmTU60s25